MPGSVNNAFSALIDHRGRVRENNFLEGTIVGLAVEVFHDKTLIKAYPVTHFNPHRWRRDPETFLGIRQLHIGIARRIQRGENLAFIGWHSCRCAGCRGTRADAGIFRKDWQGAEK